MCGGAQSQGMCGTYCVCCGGVAAGDAPGLSRFEAHLSEFREHLEVEVCRLTAAAQQLTEHKGWWDQPQQVGETTATPTLQQADAGATLSVNCTAEWLVDMDKGVAVYKPSAQQ